MAKFFSKCKNFIKSIKLKWKKYYEKNKAIDEWKSINTFTKIGLLKLKLKCKRKRKEIDI